MSRGWKSLRVHARTSVGCLEEIFGRNVEIKGDLDESSEKKKEKASLILENI